MSDDKMKLNLRNLLIVEQPELSSLFSYLLNHRSWSTGTPNRARRGESTTGRTPFISQNSSVTEAPSDEIEQEQEVDEDAEPARVTT